MDSSSGDDENLVLENGLFKLLTLDSVHFREEWVNEYFTDREEDGEYHRIFNDLLRQPEKFFDYFRMMPNTFFYILGKIAPRITKESNFRTCIGPEEKLMVTLRLSQDLSTRPSAMLLLESVTRVLPLLRLNDSALLQVVAFRDQIASTGQQPASARPSRVLEPSLQMEPRAERKKRQHPIPPDTPPETPENVGVWLQTSETAILSFSANESAEERRRLVTNLDSYVTGLCRGLADSSQLIFLGNQLVNLSVQKLSVSENFKKNLTVPTCSDNLSSCPSSPAKLILGKAFASQYKTADSVCLSGLQFPSGSLDAVFPSTSDITPLSATFRMKVLTYSISADLAALPAPSVVLYIPLLSNTMPSGNVPQCYVVESGLWTSRNCESELSDQLAICKCPAYSYYSVFSTPVPTTPPTTSPSDENVQVTETQSGITPPGVDAAEETTTSSTPQPITSIPTTLALKALRTKKVAFRIAENFERVVGNNMSAFSRLIKKQVMDQLSLPKGVIRDIYVTKGSIQVTMSLQSTQQLSAEECVAELSQALGEGQLMLRGPDNHSLEVPRQPLQVLREPRGHESGLSAAFLASAAAAVCGLFLLYSLCVTLLTKKTRRKEALRIAQRKAAQTVPRYLSLPLPHTLEGTNQTSRYGFSNGDDSDSGIYNSDGVRKNRGKDGKPG